MESLLTTLALADAVQKYSDDQPRDDHGRFGEGSGGGGNSKPSGGSDSRVGSTPDSTGRIPVPRETASAGASLANDLMSADRTMESALNRKDREGYTASGKPAAGAKARAAREEASAQYTTAVNAYRQVSDKAKTFESKHGLSVVDAWVAHNDKAWPNYRVAGSTPGKTHYVKD